MSKNKQSIEGKVITAVKGRAGWNQGTMANQFGVSQQSLSLWESGKRPVPKRHQTRLQELALKWSVDIDKEGYLVQLFRKMNGEERHFLLEHMEEITA